MKKIYTNALAIVSLCMVALSANAQGLTPPQSDKLVDGKTYTLFNYCTLSGYLGRTSWDGALINWGANADNYLTFTAQTNEGGSWSFYRDVESTVETEGEDGETVTETVVTRNYMNVPNGTGNLNINATEQTEWLVGDGLIDGYYTLVVSEGNNPEAQGYNAHLNAGGAYIVASYVGDGWYPDFYGGVLTDENGERVVKYIVGPGGEEDEQYIMADSVSCNWAFIETTHVQAFMTQAQGYKVLKDFADKYLADESYADYAQGFQTTLDAGVALYNGAEFFDEDIETINEMISAKVALYEAIERAALVEESDAALDAAVQNALKAFNTISATDDVANATETLNQALTNFELGMGDITSLGQNMSFEDLSSQGGNTTTGVQGAPTGWNVYIDGKQVVTADEVRSAGIANWHGINADSNGEGKDGNYAFGIWTSGIPQYEISQTIEGLDNGTYTITAGLMVGANGNGSRRTTQRIFGNLNSTYFASEEDYDLNLLAQDEVYSFQGNVEPVTDTEILPISVKAYVYDGTLTFGLRTDGNVAAALRSSSNPAGGDGWFKLDNFRIVGEGYNVDDALEINDFFLANLQTLLDDYDTKLYPAVRKAAEAALEASQNVNADSEKEGINNAILGIKDVMNDAFTSAAKYAELREAIDLANENLEIYSAKLGADLYGDVIMDIDDAWNDAVYTSDEEIDAAIQKLADALQECIESDEVEEGMDLTEYIRNNSFEDWTTTQGNDTSGGVENAPNGWTLVINGVEVKTASEIRAQGVSAWCAINRGDGIDVEFEGEYYEHQYTDGEHLWGIWNDNIPEVEIYQELHLPAGVYQLTADVVVQHDWSGNCITTQRLFGNQSVQMWARELDYGENFTQDMLDAQVLEEYNTNDAVTYFSYAGYDNDASYDYTSLARPMAVTFRVDEDGVAKVGFRTNNVDAAGNAHPHAGAGWFKLDNFHLTCISLGAVDAPELPDAIQNIEKGETAADAIYDLAGRRVVAPAKGVYIQNGQKVLVK